ncbi:MAG: 4Fe-4S dicluster domain-containing protein [Melioribacteraceae bacterium]|nr:4Fe-4S dicluster domain-containing protein [Melioribacteraceae bacterium]MCF8354581.1 4Fe-4S dicluster domain-containing protein [Melioribacteraceae bacterium]MCF8394933.1 4Fe-4S dicluster domain-containing protein [Melioribacteraceae bacterium]MCF8420158.1 4Fe-4S dicluster domain-containing protein [Melioribacteraceae bacterium]
MAVLITEECIDCNACETECPNNAIYAPGEPWSLNGEENEALSDERTYVVPEKCTECVGFYDEPQCIPACPTEAIIMDPDRVETKENLMARKEHLDEVGR